MADSLNYFLATMAEALIYEEISIKEFVEGVREAIDDELDGRKVDQLKRTYPPNYPTLNRRSWSTTDDMWPESGAK